MRCNWDVVDPTVKADMGCAVRGTFHSGEARTWRRCGTPELGFFGIAGGTPPPNLKCCVLANDGKSILTFGHGYQSICRLRLRIEPRGPRNALNIADLPTRKRVIKVNRARGVFSPPGSNSPPGIVMSLGDLIHGAHEVFREQIGRGLIKFQYGSVTVGLTAWSCLSRSNR